MMIYSHVKLRQDCILNKSFDVLSTSLKLMQGSNNLDYIQILKKTGGTLRDSYLEDGFLLDKSIGVGQPHRVENAKILIANTSMDTDKIKIYGSKVKVDSLFKVSEIEEAEKVNALTTSVSCRRKLQ